MFSSSQYSYSAPSSHEHDSRRAPLHPASQTAHSPFSTSALAGSPSHHAPNTWVSSTSGGMSSSLNDPFSQSRSSYQQGFIMSMSQSNTIPSTSPRFEELPVVQTKAKMNSSLTRASTIEFGKDPMFESSLRRQALDEDAPPTTSVNDIVNATFADAQAPSFSRTRNTALEQPVFSSSTRTSRHSVSTPVEPLYVVVFGYPPDKYSIAVEYFRQLGDCTEPDPSAEIINAFRIGYKQPVDAMRAVRKNGELIGGSWMVGAKWESPSRAESILGQSATHFSLQLPEYSSPGRATSSPLADVMAIDDLSTLALSHTASIPARQAPSVGTPIRLAPSALAYRKHGTVPKATAVAAVPIQQAMDAGATSIASKGILNQFTDLVFGW